MLVALESTVERILSKGVHRLPHLGNVVGIPPVVFAALRPLAGDDDGGLVFRDALVGGGGGRRGT